jgi:rhodanese-related sulfurtransferase
LPASLDELLATARGRIGHRPDPIETAAAVADGALLIDIRPIEQRSRDGEVPGAVIIDRNVLEWRVAPSSENRLPNLGDPDRVLVIMCNEGYQSSLAAATLRDIGLQRATDLDGGFQAWAAAGLPVTPAR